MADLPRGESEDIGPIQKRVRNKLRQLEKLRKRLKQAVKEKAAGRIEEVQAEIGRRLREIKNMVG